MTHTQVQFSTFISQLKDTNQTLDFFCDFKKIDQNVENIKLSLCVLNSLIGTTDLKRSVQTIWDRDKTAFDVLDILIAVRNEDGSKKFLDNKGECKSLKSLFTSVSGVVTFLEESGLADVFRTQKIKDLVDYVFGIEVGLDTNARKNRSGEIMEKVVADILEQHNIPYRQQVKSKEWKAIESVLGKDEKRFDFAIETKTKIYLVEVNFYSGGGSKLNEVARSYSEIAPKINSVDGFEFVWITDGIGWKSASNKLQEAYSIIPRVYNLTDITNFITDIETQC